MKANRNLKIPICMYILKGTIDSCVKFNYNYNYLPQVRSIFKNDKILLKNDCLTYYHEN